MFTIQVLSCNGNEIVEEHTFETQEELREKIDSWNEDQYKGKEYVEGRDYKIVDSRQEPSKTLNQLTPDTMDNLNLDKFSPKKAELTELAEKYKSLTIKGVEDKDGYALVDAARKKLKKIRCDITNTGKEMRDEANKFRTAVIDYEKELVKLIEPIEKELVAKQEAIDLEKEKIKRQELLPERQAKLRELGLEISDDSILEMDDNQFGYFHMQEKEKYLEEKERKAKEEQEQKERKLKEEQEKIEEEKRKLAEEKRLEEVKKQAEKEAQEKAIKDAELAKEKAEQDKQEAIEAERKKAAEDKQKLIEEQAQKEKETKEAEERQKREEEEEKAKLEKKKKYQKFLTDNGYIENSDEFYITRTPANVIMLYKKIGEMKI